MKRLGGSLSEDYVPSEKKSPPKKDGGTPLRKVISLFRTDNLMKQYIYKNKLARITDIIWERYITS